MSSGGMSFIRSPPSGSDVTIPVVIVSPVEPMNPALSFAITRSNDPVSGVIVARFHGVVVLRLYDAPVIPESLRSDPIAYFPRESDDLVT